MNEIGLVFDSQGSALYWHLPEGRTATSLPDSRTLWEILWQHRAELGGFAHTHPWRGRPDPSMTDITTFEALELGLGRQLLWPIVTLDEINYFARREQHAHETTAPHGKVDYVSIDPPIRLSDSDIRRLRELSTT
jgi:hypothetical protein